MSTAAPPRSPSDPAARQAGEPRLRTDVPRPRRWLSQQFAFWVRWLHIYLSLLSFTALLFFAVTGLTLNHPDWLGASEAVSHAASGSLPAGMLPPGADDTNIPRLSLEEHLRAAHGLRGALVELRADDLECTLAFKGPGYSADVTIARATAHYEINESRYGLVAILNDLHKGRDTGSVWSWLIDLSAVAMTVVSLTGLVLLFYLKRRLMTGLATAALGTALLYALYWWWVP